MQDEYIRRFYSEVCEKLGENYKIILEANNRNLNEDWIEFEERRWELEESLQDLVNNLINDDILSFEEKILKLYEYICLNYIYDDNVLYFFKREISDLDNTKYIAVDWYGRIIDNRWIENRRKHNRRVCYEFARFFAKAINDISNDDVEAFMLGDKENLHYVVGLIGKEYSIVLDLDDFNDIKDLTRLKLGLTIKGINILRDDKGEFEKVVESFNKNRLDQLKQITDLKENLDKNNTIQYLNEVIKILVKYNIDSQGFCEYIKSIIKEEGIDTEKIWIEVKGGLEKRYTRCLLFNYNSKTYLLDSVDKILTEIEELDKNKYIVNPEENQYSYYGG